MLLTCVSKSKNVLRIYDRMEYDNLLQGVYAMAASWLPPSSFPDLKRYFYEHSLFQALSPESLEEQKAVLEQKSAVEKAGFVFDATMRGIVKALLIANVVTLTANALFDHQTPGAQEAHLQSFHHSICSAWSVIAYPLYEEFVHRLVIQNSIGYLQQYAGSWIPTSLKESGVVQWLCSPSAKIVASESIFAGMHLNNIGSLSASQVAGQVAMIALQPTAAILHETTGSIAYPTLFHVLHNSGACFLQTVRSALRG